MTASVIGWTFLSPPTVRKTVIRRIASKIGRDRFPLLMKVVRADNLAKTDYAKAQYIPCLDLIDRAFREILADEDCLSLKELAINGKDLMNMGIKPGKEIGRILNHCLELVLENPKLNTQETLKALAEKMIAEY